MNVLITICGRKGSKGVKNKNVVVFCGYPLVLYTLSAATLLGQDYPGQQIDIAVNSDSEELLAIVGETGKCYTVNRPAEMAGDTAAKIPVIQYTTRMMEQKLARTYDHIIDLDITSPLRTVEDIRTCLEQLRADPSLDVVFSVVPSRRNPYFNMVRVTEHGVEKAIASNFTTRQQAPAIFDMNASIYAYQRNALLSKFQLSPFDGRCGIAVMKDTHILDIDSQEDFDMMSLLYQHHFSKLEAFLRIREYIQELKP